MTTDRSRFIFVFMEMLLLDQIFFSFERCCVAMASLVLTSQTDVPSSVILKPMYLKIFADCSLQPLTVIGILVLFSLVAGVTIVLLFSALIFIPEDFKCKTYLAIYDQRYLTCEESSYTTT